MLPVNPGSSKAVPRARTPGAQGASTTANSPRAVDSRYARAPGGGTKVGGLLMR
ncbi:hypothetical protein GCM10010510_30140 [Streptomyces anandii JCM 4720]|nr:hypothetical protein GCM10010510_30140 [Streptomyces anandii JCM 4720]